MEIQTLHMDDLPLEDRQLIETAQETLSFAYCRYSSFAVGAAASLDNGKVLTAANYENASFPAGVCAERLLVGNISAAYSTAKIVTIAITAYYKEQPIKNPVTPCGICRQVLYEQSERQKKPIRLLLNNGSDKVIVVPDASLLLPLAFDSGAFKHDANPDV